MLRLRLWLGLGISRKLTVVPAEALKVDGHG